VVKVKFWYVQTCSIVANHLLAFYVRNVISKFVLGYLQQHKLSMFELRAVVFV